MPSHHLVLCHLLLILPSVFSSTRVFSNELALGIRWPKYWSFSFSMCRSNEYSGLISFRKDWFDLPAIQGTLKRLLQHHSSNVSVLWHSGFFMVPLSHSYMTTGKTIVLTIQTFIGKVGGEDSGSIRGRGKDWRLQAHWGLLWNTGDVLVLFIIVIILILGFFKVEVSLNYSIVLVVFWLLICVVVVLAC